MRYIIFDDGDHERFVLREDNFACYEKEFMCLLAKPHSDNCEIAIIFYDDLDREGIPEDVRRNCYKVSYWDNRYTKEEFDQMWKYISEKITEEE